VLMFEKVRVRVRFRAMMIRVARYDSYFFEVSSCFLSRVTSRLVRAVARARASFIESVNV
jgi:hypothetical protein